MNPPEAALLAALELAVVVRDEIGEGVTHAAEAFITACGGDPTTAATVLAALVPIDLPLDRWWLDRTLATARKVEAVRVPGRLAPCGTHAAFARHRAKGQKPCRECVLGERAYQRDTKRRKRAQQEAAA